MQIVPRTDVPEKKKIWTVSGVLQAGSSGKMFPNKSYHVNFREYYEQNFRIKPEFYNNKNPIFGLIEAFLILE